MPLSLNEIKDRALAFSREWESEKSESAEAQTFWNEFFNVFGVTRRRLASFEEPVKRARKRFEEKGGKGGFIDLLWKGMLVAEHKSAGKDLDSAYKQVLEYFEGLAERDLPRYIIVSDFARIRLHDLDTDTRTEFPLKDLYKHIKLLGFIAGYTTQRIEAQDPVNIKAAERMGKLHDRLRSAGYEGHVLEVMLVRLLFCLFAEDTTLFEPRGSFRDFIENNTVEDGSDLGPKLSLLFQVLNTAESKRQKGLDEVFTAFPYVNGRLFEETLPISACDSAMRALLLDCCALDWGRISPAVFGALFQCVMDEEGSARRRNLGAHYTSEENILKLIKALFLDDLWAEFESAKRNTNKLFELHKKLSGLKFFDPACGCGNFLVIAYRELRLLELEILRAAHKTSQMKLDTLWREIQVDVNQFYGIEIEEFPAQIAQVALWLTDHQMNMKVSEEFGQYFRRLPLIHSASILCGNALQMDWNKVISAEHVDYILGNPPFVGKHYQNAAQKADMALVFRGVKGASDLDYVAAWYIKAAHYVRGDDRIAGFLDNLPDMPKPPRERVKIAFVSTNSITQGEQVSLLWAELLQLGVRIHFAHRTFRWSNEARGQAAVHCVIIGFALFDIPRKRLFEYADLVSEPHEIAVDNITPYLAPGPDIIIKKRQTPICNVSVIRYGNKPSDNGNFIIDEEERKALIKSEPDAARFIRSYMGSEDFINSKKRYCLWLKDASPRDLRVLPEVMARVERVRDFRAKSSAAPTREAAKNPTLFFYTSQPDTDYLVIPETSSERRQFIPIGYASKNIIASNALWMIPQASLYTFSMLCSTMHMAWVRQIAGRLKSDYRYTGSLVYNNFPWPSDLTDKQKTTIEDVAQGVLDARAAHPDASLADLYDPVAMPPDLRKAHQALDKSVDAAYGKKTFASDAERVAFLFELYHKYTSLLPAPEKSKRRRIK
ncbi:MAG: N-6 DNA methylase [Nitrospirae bacterium]|nr:N-6 DNA methylase [Nitrospirota bacterium]